MPDRLLINFWGLTVSADGVVAISAAVIIVLAALILMRGRRFL